MRELRLGTRGSPLALAQTKLVMSKISELAGGTRLRIEIIRTRGDTLSDVDRRTVDGKMIFTREIEEALLDGRIDMAVHSTKDLTAQLPDGLMIGGVLERTDPRDVLISRSKVMLEDLPQGAKVGTSSPRRRVQLQAARPDVEVMDIHGNVDTRLRKLREGQCDALILAAAGLIRLGLEDRITQYLPIDVMLPAVGQGAIAVEIRESDHELTSLLTKIDHPKTRIAIEAERAFAERLGATCQLPLAAHAKVDRDEIRMHGMIADERGRKLLREKIVSKNLEGKKIGYALAESMIRKGAEEILVNAH